VERPVIDLLAIASAVILAATFLVAAVAKFRSKSATTTDFQSLGLPQPALWAVVVPLLEVITAFLLLVVPGWGGVAAFTLLAAFTANLALVLRSGRVATCACFGGASATPVSGRHLLRNAVLLALALMASTFDGWIFAAAS
jgi:uncharacterized membrane protein YphA (DoxX/SURF4 family)